MGKRENIKSEKQMVLLYEKRSFVIKIFVLHNQSVCKFKYGLFFFFNKHWNTCCMSVEVLLYSRGSDSAVFIQAGLPEVSDDLGCQHSEICLQGGFHKQSL